SRSRSERPLMSETLRVGIDVGGTFTDVVAVDAATREIVATIKVPTTHRAAGGVAAGIVEGLRRLLASGTVRAEQIAFIAHSTTQATNALLEGDVARVGVIGLLDTYGGLARAQMRGLGPPDLTRFVRAGDSAALRT